MPSSATGPAYLHPPDPKGLTDLPSDPPNPPNRATVDKGPWSVEQVVRQRREGLESEVVRVKEKADRVGTMLGQREHIGNMFAMMFGICIFGIFCFTFSAMFGDIGGAIGGAIWAIFGDTYCVIIIETQTRVIAHCAALRG